jgi:two-component system sensor histidine kinase CpxA
MIISNFYWKTFLRFCTVTMVLMLTLATVYFSFFYRYSPASPDRPVFSSYAGAAVSVYEFGGPDALLDWLTLLEEERGINIYLLDTKGHDVLGRTLPIDVQESYEMNAGWKKILPPHLNHVNPLRKNKLFFTQVISKQGKAYYLITDIPHIQNRKIATVNAQKFGLRLLIGIIIGGLVCVWLIWYLTKPVSKLRKATQQWSTGDLTARIGNDLGNRQDEISALGRDLDKMAERLQAMMASQQRLLSDVSHELRTPLARLQIALGLARQRAGEKAQGDLDRIELEAERLNEMIGQILSLVRLETLEQMEEKEETDIVELLTTIINNAEFENRDKDKHVQLSALNPHLPKIHAEPNLIYSALENIIRNAMRYTPNHTTVEAGVKYINKQIQITVRDHGPGIPENMLEKVFEPFFRVADARDRKSGGYGLGLAIVKRAVEIHGGKVWANNAPEGGLVITILLPII